MVTLASLIQPAVVLVLCRYIGYERSTAVIAYNSYCVSYYPVTKRSMEMDNLKLFQKSMLVVSIPLLIGLSLLAILGYLLRVSELEERGATHSKTVISEAERL